MTDALKLLRLLQLADSALPIGSQAHSFGLETLVAENRITTASLANYIGDYVSEIGTQDGWLCRAAHRLASTPIAFTQAWLTLNRQASALRLAHEVRTASATLGRRLLTLGRTLLTDPRLCESDDAARATGVEVHHAPVFGLIGGVLALDEEATVLAYLQQGVAGLLAAAQKVLPVGQSQVMTILWGIKPALIAAAERSRHLTTPPPAFASLVELAGMRHARQPVRLFIS